MWSTTKLQFGLIVLIVVICLSPFITTPASATTAQLEIMSIDSAQHPTLHATVVVHDLYGQGVANLGAENFVIEEGDQTIPGELIQIQSLDNTPQPVTIAVVADISVFLGKDELTAIRKDIQSFVEQLVNANNTSIEVGLFVPTDGRSDAESTFNVPFTIEDAPIVDALTNITPHEDQTPLYNTIVTTINTTANRAEQRGGPAYVVVFGDGIDRTSIVGSGSAGANEAAQIAETRHVQVNAFGYGQSLNEGSGALRQLTGRTNGQYQPAPDTRQITDFAEQLQDVTTKGIYELSYTSALPADGSEHSIDIHTNVGALRLSANTQVFIPREWDRTMPIDMDVQFDLQAYPDITLWARPINQLRQTVPDLTNQDFTLSLDGEPLEVAIDVNSVPLDANDPAASQSIALVVDQTGLSAEDVRNSAVTLLQDPALSNSRMSLFVPGIPNEAPEFTHDHNALINMLRQIPVDASTQSSASATLQRAIDEVARDGTNAQRPAAVILLSDREIPLDERARTLTIARDLGVIIHTITPNGSDAVSTPAYLSEATTGAHLSNPQPTDLPEFAANIAQQEANSYRITFQMPLLEEQRAYSLEVQVADVSATEDVLPVVQGTMDLRSPLPVYAQVLLFITLASVLTASAFAPNYINNRRNLCPKCQRVRRKSWGNSCLFCEHQTAQNQEQSANEIPLTGFALQGASLVQPNFADHLTLRSTSNTEARQQSSPAAQSKHASTHQESEPVFHKEAQQQEIVEAQPDHTNTNGAGTWSGKLDATSEALIRQIVFEDEDIAPPHVQDDQADPTQDTSVPAISNGNDSYVETENKPSDPVDQARSQTHTDFWGALPNEQTATAIPEPMMEDEPASAVTQPPPLPIFQSHHRQPTAPKPRQPVPQEIQEPTHTDFWGPLPTDDHTGMAAQAEEWIRESTYTPSEERAEHHLTHDKAGSHDEEVATQTEEHTPSSPRSTAVAKPTHDEEQSLEKRDSVDHPQESHTDFWGPLG
ncbi:MAG: hypothetical protein GFH27_549293n91 [Chloroflexi bacterium AL-W]|nr:hypothetical protein [Chloroflexi bacterium AL-N1]NOK67794.1 hypothetical protein [Chloroflexi bacterium AL-N10]NOK75436.1 hypothetical protein [Chloroflexi bacterium AL-N5]NOK82224.1 hypothetical protein [Chloroflexi bacterium AL-W]NOK90069.1 hypothetical protein [Chloroflexi bacterium AL-N15]